MRLVLKSVQQIQTFVFEEDNGTYQPFLRIGLDFYKQLPRGLELVTDLDFKKILQTISSTKPDVEI